MATFRDQWFNDLKELKCNKEIFRWFGCTRKLDDQNKSLNMLLNKWQTTKNKVVESTISPLEGITLPVEGKVITTSPFTMDIKDTKGDPTNKDKNKILQQNNYRNQLLYVVSNQILRDDNKSDIKDKLSSSYKDKNKNLETYPIIKLPELPKAKFSNIEQKLEISNELIGIINESFKSKTINNLYKDIDNEINKLSSNYSTKMN
ncbi:hypothetical protein H5410_056819 [Solanum commersonii]|uniref:Uncharacterized protein n=1 Tax=Solanum commersonii TaxID=4109 RepID=A0A9J5WMV7_SOLCO|nr:hypothetical protein H5410_056819 [Solanum commersonii]